MSSAEWHPIPLSFEVSEDSSDTAEGRRLTVTSIVRDDHGVRISYEIVPPLPEPLHGPHGVADDDLGNRYEDLGGAVGRDPVRDVTDGVLTMPLPADDATTLRVRFNWSQGPRAWRQTTHEVHIRLGSDTAGS